MRKNKHTIGKKWTDSDDAPALDRAWFKRADVYKGKKLVRRGRPKKEDKKVAIHFRIDPDLLAALKANGSGWQTQMHSILREALEDGRI